MFLGVMYDVKATQKVEQLRMVNNCYMVTGNNLHMNRTDTRSDIDYMIHLQNSLIRLSHPHNRHNDRRTLTPTHIVRWYSFVRWANNRQMIALLLYVSRIIK